MATISGNFLCYSAASSAKNPTKITSIVFTTERYNEDKIKLNATINFTIGPDTGGNFTVGDGPRYLFVKYNGNFYQSNSNLTLKPGEELIFRNALISVIKEKIFVICDESSLIIQSKDNLLMNSSIELHFDVSSIKLSSLNFNII